MSSGAMRRLMAASDARSGSPARQSKPARLFKMQRRGRRVTPGCAWVLVFCSADRWPWRLVPIASIAMGSIFANAAQWLASCSQRRSSKGPWLHLDHSRASPSMLMLALFGCASWRSMRFSSASEDEAVAASDCGGSRTGETWPGKAAALSDMAGTASWGMSEVPREKASTDLARSVKANAAARCWAE